MPKRKMSKDDGGIVRPSVEKFMDDIIDKYYIEKFGGWRWTTECITNEINTLIDLIVEEVLKEVKDETDAKKENSEGKIC